MNPHSLSQRIVLCSRYLIGSNRLRPLVRVGHGCLELPLNVTASHGVGVGIERGVPVFLLLMAVVANACGTFAAPDPVEQSGERVLFRQDGPKEWTAFVEVQFAGGVPGQDFGWIIPVASGFDVENDVSVAPAGLFDALERATAPRFVGPGHESLVQGVGGCSEVPSFELPDLTPEASNSYLLGEAVVGPYQIELLGGDTASLLGWLTDQGYSLPAGADVPIGEYVDDGYQFIGVTLVSDAVAGPVETLVLDCGMTEPSVPLKLTALTAKDDMPITAYVLSDERMAPSAPWTEVIPDLDGVLNTEGYEKRLRSEQNRTQGRNWTVEYASSATELLAVLEPEAAVALGHGGYLTRMRAFVDPDQMDDDPVFVADPTAPDVGVLLRPGVDFAGAPLLPSLVALGLAVLLGRRREV